MLKDHEPSDRCCDEVDGILADSREEAAAVEPTISSGGSCPRNFAW
jgi:hypothetical protein